MHLSKHGSLAKKDYGYPLAVDDVSGNGGGNESAGACQVGQLVTLGDGSESEANEIHGSADKG